MEEKVLTEILFKASCPGNEILYDDAGKPSVMVKIPKKTYAQLGLGDSERVHPAFLVNGKEIEAVYISKYENVIEDGRAYSLPGEKPSANMNFDEALEACSKKGKGWHLMSKAEWAMLAQWCLNNGTLPRGNSQFGKDAEEQGYKALPAVEEQQGKINLVMTGTGPLTWSHDGTTAGIWDLKGNLGEWVCGARTVFGELQLLIDNDGADSTNLQTADSGLWRAIDGKTGEYIIPDGKGTTKNSLKLIYDGSIWKWTSREKIPLTDKFYGCAYKLVECEDNVGEKARLLLQALGFFKVDRYTYQEDFFYANSGMEERFFGCGGHFRHKNEAGIFCTHGTTGREDTSPTRGFRSAYIKLSEE